MSPRHLALLSACSLSAAPLFAGEIHEAATRGDIALLRALASRGPAARSSTDKSGLTALHLAVMHRQPEAVAVLLAEGAPVDPRDPEGQTPLHYLAHSVEESVVENFQNAGGGKFGDALATLTQSGQAVTPAKLLGLLRADLAEVDEPLKLLRNFGAATTAEQLEAELKSARALLAAHAEVDALDKERSTPLHHAAMSPWPDLARLLIEAGAKVNVQNSGGLTPLHNAALFGSADTVKFLLEHGAEPEGRTVLLGVPPLVMAVTRGETRAAAVLLDHRADVDALGPDGETALARAAALGATDVARLLLDRGARAQVRVGRSNRTPLHLAAAHGFVPLIQLLLERGAEVDTKDGEGFTPLHDAAERGRTLAIRTLLNAGAKADTPNAVGRTALWLAASRGQVECAGYLVNHGADPALAAADGQSPLHIAAFNARPGALRVMLERKPSLSGPSRLGTPLHCAAAGPTMRAYFASQVKPGQPAPAGGTAAEAVACVKLLMEAGAPLDATDASGATPLQAAAAFGNKPALELLAGKGVAALAARDPRGLTALHHAARGPVSAGAPADTQPALPPAALSGCGDTTAFLIERGVPVNSRDEAGLTPLHLAASTGNLPALKALLFAKADLRAVDKSGGTPLHWAAARGREDAVKALLGARAAVAAADGEGQTPLLVAVAGGHGGIVRLLLDAGADPNAANRRGQNALAYAESFHRSEIARTLRERGAKAGLPTQ